MKKFVYIGIAILIIALCALIFFGSWKVTTKLLGIGTEVTTETGISLPDIKGLGLEEAKQKLEEVGVKYEIEEQYNDTVEQGKIIEQDPVAGANYDVNKHRPVKIIMSKGVKMVVVPKVIGLTYDEAVAELEKYELKAEEVPEANLEVEAGIVTKQDIKENEEIIAGTTIKLNVSTGPEKVTVPSVVDTDVEEAKKILTDKKLEVNVLYEENTSKSEGVVLKQSIEVGSVVNEGDAINITVNKIEKIKQGTVNINVKSLTGYKEPEKPTTGEDGNEDETGGSTETAKPKNVSLKVTVDDEVIYKQDVPENTENVNVTVEGKGTVDIKVYINEVRERRQQMDLNSDNTILDIK